MVSAVYICRKFISGVDTERTRTVSEPGRQHVGDLYNPQTASGKIVVNGIVASTVLCGNYRRVLSSSRRAEPFVTKCFSA
jgi:hypothetical protein